MKTIILTFFTLFCLGGEIFSQTLNQTIKGTVLDKQSQYPLPGAVIQVLNTKPILNATTNDNGEFKITNVPIGRWQIKIQLIGYKEKYQIVVLNSGKEVIKFEVIVGVVASKVMSSIANSLKIATSSPKPPMKFPVRTS